MEEVTKTPRPTRGAGRGVQRVGAIPLFRFSFSVEQVNSTICAMTILSVRVYRLTCSAVVLYRKFVNVHDLGIPALLEKHVSLLSN